MRLFAGTIVQGLVSGCVIALLAAGVTITYRSLRVLNFAHGSFATLSAYVYYAMVVTLGWPALPAVVLTLAVAAAAGVLADIAVVRPLERAEPQARAAATIGAVLVIQWIVLTIWGGAQRFVPSLSARGISLGGIRLGAQHIAIVVTTVALGAVLSIALTRTRAGLALAATAQDAEAVRLLGVSPRAVARATMIASSVTAAIAGILATPLLVLTPSQMTLVFVVSLGAALAGGFSSLGRTVIAGLALGVLQSVVTSYAPDASGLPQASGFLAVLVVLAVVRSRANLVDLVRGTA